MENTCSTVISTTSQYMYFPLLYLNTNNNSRICIYQKCKLKSEYILFTDCFLCILIFYLNLLIYYYY